MITPRVGVSGIEFVRSREGSEEKLVETVSLEVIKWAMDRGAKYFHMSSLGKAGAEFRPDLVLTILRQEAEK